MRTDEAVIDVDGNTVFTVPALGTKVPKPAISITKIALGKGAGMAKKATASTAEKPEEEASVSPAPRNKKKKATTRKPRKKKVSSSQAKIADLQEQLARTQTLLEAAHEEIVSQQAAVPEEVEEILEEEEIAPEDEDEDEDSGYLAEIQVLGYGSITIPIDSVLCSDNQTILLLGTRKGSKTYKVAPAGIDSGHPARATIIVGVDCTNPRTFPNVVNMGTLPCPPLKTEFQVYLSLPKLNEALEEGEKLNAEGR